jgi:inorganic pyrophosphatase
VANQEDGLHSANSIQTWEDPNVIHPETKAKGDNDPLDVCEIGELVGYTGQVKQVKVLGVMALLDEEETDWKIIVIDVSFRLPGRDNFSAS